MVDFKVSGEASIDPDDIVADVDEIIAKLDEFMSKVDEVDEKLDEMSHKDLNISVLIDGMDKLDDLSLRLADLDDTEHEVTLRINIDGTDSLDKLYLEILELELTDHTVRIDVKTDGIEKSAVELETLDKTLDDNKKKTDASKSSTDSFEFSLAMLAPLLIPLSSALIAATGGLGGLASAFGTMIPPVALAAYGVDQLYKSVSTLYAGLNANTQAALMNATTYGQMWTILDRNSKSFQNMSSLMQEGIINFVTLKQVIGQFESAIQENGLLVLINGFRDLTTIISMLIDPANEAAGALAGILQDFSDRLNDPTFQTFFDNMDKNIGTLVTDWGTGVLNIVEGIVAILNAFMPLSLDMSGGFLSMTQSFDTWAQHLAQSEGFKKFVADVEKDGPVILGILGNLVHVIANVVGALGEQSGSSGFLDFLDKVLKTLSSFTTTHQGLTQASGDLLLLGAAASKLGPLLAPIIEFLTTPVGLIVVGILALGAAFVYAYEKSQTFRDWVQQNLVPMFKQLEGDLVQLKQWFISIWPDIQKAWQLYGKNILDILTSNLQETVSNVGHVLTLIEGMFELVLGVLTGHWGLAWDGIKKIFSSIWDIIVAEFNNVGRTMGNIMIMIGTALKQNWEAAWRNIEQVMSTYDVRIEDDVANFFYRITTDAGNWAEDFVNAINNGGKWVANFFSSLPGNIVRWLGNMGSLLIQAGENLISGLISGIENSIPGLSSTLGWITSLIPSWKGPEDTDKNLLYDSGQMIMDGLVNGLESRYSKVQNSLGGLTKTIGNTFGNQFTKDISAQIDTALTSSSSVSPGSGAGLPGSGGQTQVTFAAGSIQVNNPTPETAGTTLTRTLQGVSAWGTIQTPTGFTTG